MISRTERITPKPNSAPPIVIIPHHLMAGTLFIFFTFQLRKTCGAFLIGLCWKYISPSKSISLFVTVAIEFHTTAKNFVYIQRGKIEFCALGNVVRGQKCQQNIAGKWMGKRSGTEHTAWWQVRERVCSCCHWHFSFFFWGNLWNVGELAGHMFPILFSIAGWKCHWWNWSKIFCINKRGK